MKCQAPSIDEVLSVCIDSIWTKYDADGYGYLDREETEVFINDSIIGQGQPKKPKSHFFDDDDDENEALTPQQFEACF